MWVSERNPWPARALLPAASSMRPGLGQDVKDDEHGELMVVVVVVVAEVQATMMASTEEREEKGYAGL